RHNIHIINNSFLLLAISLLFTGGFLLCRRRRSMAIYHCQKLNCRRSPTLVSY
ncbi:LPXTG cell wall anchor domain-containing protein, partial [Salmonella enterica]|nr:LPXTG cell wall anchor domain-containing protein [Salmonella enterica]